MLLGGSEILNFCLCSSGDQKFLILAFVIGEIRISEFFPGLLGGSEILNFCLCYVCVCLLITLTRGLKAELLRAQLNGFGQMHMKGASGCRQTVMNGPGGQQPSQIFLTWVKARDHNTGNFCLLYTSPSPRDLSTSRMPSSA